MQSFPTLKLPFLALINVLDNLDHEELFVFSLVSNRTKDLAIAARRKVSNLSWHLNYFRIEHGQRIEVGKGVMHFPMRKTLEEAGQTEKLEKWKLNGQLIPMYRTTCGWFIGDRRGREHYYELMDMLSKHILKVFRCEDFELWTSLRSAPEDLFVYKHTRKFSILNYTGCKTMPADHLKFALEQLESELFEVNPKVPSFKWSGPLNMSQLIVGEAEWITFEALMNNKCNVLLLDEHIFTGAELNTFLKKWLAGGFPRLEYCSFDGPIEHSRDEVLQDIKTMRSNQANHPENRAKHPFHAVYDDDSDYNDLSDGVDIRSNNGVLATIDVDSYGFAMAVWKNA